MRKNVFRSGEAIKNPPGFARCPAPLERGEARKPKNPTQKILGTRVGIIRNSGKEEREKNRGKRRENRGGKRIPVRGRARQQGGGSPFSMLIPLRSSTASRLFTASRQGGVHDFFRFFAFYFKSKKRLLSVANQRFNMVRSTMVISLYYNRSSGEDPACGGGCMAPYSGA